MKGPYNDGHQAIILHSSYSDDPRNNNYTKIFHSSDSLMFLAFKFLNLKVSNWLKPAIARELKLTAFIHNIMIDGNIVNLRQDFFVLLNFD